MISTTIGLILSVHHSTFCVHRIRFILCVREHSFG